LAAVAALGAMVVLTAGALLLYKDLSRDLSAAITEQLSIRVSDLAIDFEDGEVTAGSGVVTAQAIYQTGDVLSPSGAPPLLTTDELARALRGQIVVDRDVPEVNQHARLLARRIGGHDPEVVVGVSAISTTELVHARDRLTTVLAAAGPALAAAIGATVWILTGAALRPVRRMTGEAATISMADVGRRLAEPEGEDEIAALGRTLNAMLARIEETIVRERAFIDDAAHELRTPIAVLRGELELAAQDVDDHALVAQGLTSALEEADRLTRLTEDLLTLARADAGQLVPGNATTELLSAARAVARHLPRRDDVRIEVRGEPTTVRSEQDWIRQIITNLVANADRYASSKIVISVAPANGDGVLVVADDGPGFPTELLPRAFDRFARGDEARGRTEGGAGLGLAITASLARALGGTATACNGAPLQGACVQIELPLAVP
jgi:signal transduction histidine kinase